MAIVFDRERLEALFQDFYTVTGLRIALFDRYGCEMAAYPKKVCMFCAYIREDTPVEEACLENDRSALSSCSEEPRIYRCHMGLTEAAAPIRHSGILLGYIMIGQMLTQGEESWANTAACLEKYRPADAKAKQYYEKITRLPEEKISSALHLMTACTAYILTQNLVLHREDFTSDFLQYVEEHLDGQLDIPLLCQAFSVGKTQLCTRLKNETGMTVSRIIRQQRLDRARQLLLETALPVMEVAATVGIDDYNYFSRLFKKEIGISPTEFRKKMQKETRMI